MNFINEITEFKKVSGKLYQIITREIDPASIDDEINELDNVKAEKENRKVELNLIKNL